MIALDSLFLLVLFIPLHADDFSVDSGVSGCRCITSVNFCSYSPVWKFVNWEIISTSISDAGKFFIILHSTRKSLFGSFISLEGFPDFSVLDLNRKILPPLFFLMVNTGSMCHFIYTVACHYIYIFLLTLGEWSSNFRHVIYSTVYSVLFICLTAREFISISIMGSTALL